MFDSSWIFFLNIFCTHFSATQRALVNYSSPHSTLLLYGKIVSVQLLIHTKSFQCMTFHIHVFGRNESQDSNCCHFQCNPRGSLQIPYRSIILSGKVTERKGGSGADAGGRSGHRQVKEYNCTLTNNRIDFETDSKPRVLRCHPVLYCTSSINNVIIIIILL